MLSLSEPAKDRIAWHSCERGPFARLPAAFVYTGTGIAGSFELSLLRGTGGRLCRLVDCTVESLRSGANHVLGRRGSFLSLSTSIEKKGAEASPAGHKGGRLLEC